LSLAIAERIALAVVKKFNSEGCTGRAVQTALNVGVPTPADDRGDYWIILQIVWARIDIAIVIGLDAVGVAVKLQIDPEAGVRENGVAEDGVVDGAGVMHPDSGEKALHIGVPPPLKAMMLRAPAAVPPTVLS